MVKNEPTTCENCNCGSCCGWKCLWSILTILWCIAAIIACIFAYKAFQKTEDIYKLNVLSAGWEENLQKMNELYASDAYVKYATEQTEWYISSFMSAYWNTDEDNTDTNDEDTVSDDEETNNASVEDVKSTVENMLSTSPIRGDKDARFTIVEYTELHCPFCQRHSQAGTINSVIEQFPGEVNSVSRHFIIHWEDALNLAAAMECVAELKPEVYHNTFEKAFDAYPVDLEGLVSIASELGVDKTNLQTCIDEWRYTKAVEDMMNQASSLFGVNGTPGNVIIDRETGKYKLVSGAYPVEDFVNAINELKNS